MGDLERGRSGFANQAIDGAALEAYLGLLALLGDSSHDAADFEIIVLRSSNASEESSAIGFGQEDA